MKGVFRWFKNSIHLFVLIVLSANDLILFHRQSNGNFNSVWRDDRKNRECDKSDPTTEGDLQGVCPLSERIRAHVEKYYGRRITAG
jgi:hypothetical protein